MRSLIVGATLALLLAHSSTVFAQQGFKFSSDYVVLAGAKTLPQDIPTLYKIKKSVLGNLQGENVMEKLPYIKLAFDAQHLIYVDALRAYPKSQLCRKSIFELWLRAVRR